MGDINIDTHDTKHPGYNKLKSFRDVLGLSNLVTGNTCFSNQYQSSIDVILTNCPKSFQLTSVYETGLNDCHGLIATTMKSHIPRLKPKNIIYRTFKNFNSKDFFLDVKNIGLDCNIDDPNNLYTDLSVKFRKVVDKHAPLKKKFLRGNNAPFINRNLKKAIYVRTNLKKKFIKNPTNENKARFKKHRNKCVSLRKKAIRDHFKKATSKGLMSNKDFWNLVKPFLSNKGGLSDGEKMITDGAELTEVFNDHYINIVQKSSGKKPTSVAENYAIKDDREAVKKILPTHKNHPSVLAIIQNPNNNFEPFSFKEVENSAVLRLLKEVDGRKSTGREDNIPPKLVSLASVELTAPLTNAINSSIRNSQFLEREKRASVCPLDKGEQDETVERNIRPVSVLNAFSKIYEKVVRNQLIPHLDKSLSVFIAAYRERYRTQHVSIRLIEEWRLRLDNDYVVGAILMDLSKALDCIPHDLLIAKLAAYGLDENSLVYIHSYLKRREQCDRINNTYSKFQLILSGVPQGSVLGPILFNFFINDLILFFKKASVYNYADDNTLVHSSKTMSDLIDVLEGEANISLEWLKNNNMIANPEKFRACSNGGEPAHLPGWSFLPRSHIIPNSNTKFDFCSYEQAGWPAKQDLTGVLARSR